MVKPVEDKTTGKVRYKCLKCGSLLSHKQYIKEHMKIHTGDKSFACSTCNRAFRNKYMLKVLLMLLHSLETS
jgi:DNA-directed RNA polymerase subunit RPC12/RpoP